MGNNGTPRNGQWRRPIGVEVIGQCKIVPLYYTRSKTVNVVEWHILLGERLNSENDYSEIHCIAEGRTKWHFQLLVNIYVYFFCVYTVTYTLVIATFENLWNQLSVFWYMLKFKTKRLFKKKKRVNKYS